MFRGKFPFVALRGGVSLIPLDRDYLLLTDGDETAAAADFELTIPEWLHDMAACFSECAYIEAAIWGGTGMQACVVFDQQGNNSEPVISSGAINFALQRMGVADGFSGLPAHGGKDLFDVVGLGRHRSTKDWL